METDGRSGGTGCSVKITIQMENLYGLAVDAITVFVASPVFALYCS